MTDKAKISEIVDRITKSYDPEKVILFGSYVTNKINEESDLDFIIIKDTDKPKHKRGRELRRHLLGLLIPIDLKIYTPSEFENESKSDYSFLSSAMKNSIVLYERKS